MPRRESIQRFARFLAVGTCSAAVDFTTLHFLHTALAATEAFSLAWIAGVVTHFLLNKYWTFRCGRRDVFKQLGQYLGVVALNYVVQLIVFKTILGFWPAAGIYAAKAAAIPMATIPGFFLFKKHVFERELAADGER
jgi:putative flippase GtrA